MYGVTFLTVEPAYECRQSMYHDSWYSCDKTIICEYELSKEDWRIDYSGDESYINWVDPEKLDLICVSPNKIGMLGSAYFVGFAISSAFTPKLSDVFGRKMPYMVCIIIQTISYIFIIKSQSLNLTIGFFVIVGLCAAGRVAIGANYVCEFLPDDK